MQLESHKMLANEYTKESLQKLNKPQLIAMVVSQRDETKVTIESLRDEVKEMNTNFKKLEADVSIVKTVHNHLIKKAVDIEQHCWENSEYSRRECLEIAGIPTSIPQQNLEEKVCQMFEAMEYQLPRMILTTVIGFETRNERLLSSFDARTASKFFDAKKICEAST